MKKVNLMLTLEGNNWGWQKEEMIQGDKNEHNG